MIYITSDTHFNHSKIIKFERINFKTIEEHDYKIFDIIEQTLKKDDELWNIGDFGYLDDYLKIKWNKLKCKKVLIMGNHDKNKDYLAELFDEIYNHPVYLNKRIVLSHYPIQVNKDVLNIHGHLHNSILSLDNYINANIHITNYKLLKLDNILNKLASIPKESVKFLEEWYAPYYNFISDYPDFIYKNGILDVEDAKTKIRKKKEDR